MLNMIFIADGTESDDVTPAPPESTAGSEASPVMSTPSPTPPKRNHKIGIMILIAVLVVLAVGVALLETSAPISANTSSTSTTVQVTSTTIPVTNATVPANYSLSTSFVNNSGNYNLTIANISKNSHLFVFPNNTTAIYETLIINQSPVQAANTVIQAYSIVELFPSPAQAESAFNFKKQDILSVIDSKTANITQFSSPAIGNSTFSYTNSFPFQNQDLFVLQFVTGSAFVRVGTYEISNSSATLPIAIAQKVAKQIGG
jgi:hypothetical protein